MLTEARLVDGLDGRLCVRREEVGVGCFTPSIIYPPIGIDSINCRVSSKTSSALNQAHRRQRVLRGLTIGTLKRGRLLGRSKLREADCCST